MEFYISDLLDDLMDSSVEIVPQSVASTERIKELTMNKLNLEKSGKRSGHRRIGRILMIAAIIAALATTAYAIAARNLHWSQELTENMERNGYQQNTNIGAVSKNWEIDGTYIALSAEHLSETGLTIKCDEWSQDDNSVLDVEKEYWIERWDGENYVEIPTQDGKPWENETQSVPCGGSTSWDISWEAAYGKLAPGNYRVGMMFSKTSPEGQTAQLGCYAKFVLYTEEIQSDVDTYCQAFERLTGAADFHLKEKQSYFGEDIFALEDIWKAGNDYASHTRTYNSDGSFRWDFGDMLRGGKGYTVKWDGEDMTEPVTGWQTADYMDKSNFMLWTDEFEYLPRYVDKVTRNGDEVVFCASRTFEAYEEEDPVEITETWEVRVCYDPAGEISRLDYLSKAQEIEVTVVPVDHGEAAAQIANIDVTNPVRFSYEQEMAALAVLAYEKKTEGFPQGSSTVTAANAASLARKACTLTDSNVDSVFYDRDTKMWKIEFGVSWDSWVYQVVYMDGSGTVQMVATRPYPATVEEPLLPLPSEYQP